MKIWLVLFMVTFFALVVVKNIWPSAGPLVELLIALPFFLLCMLLGYGLMLEEEDGECDQNSPLL